MVTLVLPLALGAFSSSPAHAVTCERTIYADVVAFDQPFFYNRLGAVNPAGMIYALRRDVIAVDPDSRMPVGSPPGVGLSAGNVALRPDKRPRPIVLRMNAGDCLEVKFQNLLADPRANEDQPNTRTASVHVIGMQLVGGIGSDGSNVGKNPSSLAAPGEYKTYTFHAEREGTHLLYSGGAMTGGEGDGGSLAMGLFGTVNVEPKGAEWYRSQVTEEEMRLATKNGDGTLMKTAQGHPILDYDAVYPDAEPWISEGKAGLPVLKMLDDDKIVHSELNAIITGPGRGSFPSGTYPPNPVIAPDDKHPREEPFREFTVVFHDEIKAVQAFEEFEDEHLLSFTLHSVRDGFAINYGTGGIGAEILANRKGLGPMKDCTECKYEEFFLTSWAVGDPSMVVDLPANASNPAADDVATMAFYPADPSNVHHSYISDHVKFRNVHAGPKEHHIFHLHAHQWLFTPDSDESTYLDSQAIGPGSAYTYEITYDGSGNRNKTVGDAIFHCHFYPHFAQGMWELWRNHDVFETGTLLEVSDGPDGFHADPFALQNGTPALHPDAGKDGVPADARVRSLPDGEIVAGTPIPAIVPIPTIAMAPMPQADVRIVGGQAEITPLGVGDNNPGYPFFIAGVAGHRPPHPPHDTEFDGGLPRHVLTAKGTAFQEQTRWSFDKVLTSISALQLPEDGTEIEKAAMSFHSKVKHASYTPDGSSADFITNGMPQVAGAPFADPCVVSAGTPPDGMIDRTYRAAVAEMDLKFNKVGWHFPQARILMLWGDVDDTLNDRRPPEPFFFRANTNDCITYYHTNLVPNVYQLDDFQVKTPTDVIGQHIHLVKFDVTSSDGSGNGWNYEDGTFSPGEVKERIHAIKASGGAWTPIAGGPERNDLAPKPHPYFGKFDQGICPDGPWCGAQTTVQRWYADDVVNNAGDDRTLRSVFTHDHFAPSTHQHPGLYAVLVIEPKDSRWRDPESGVYFGARDLGNDIDGIPLGTDGGPTSWRADILTGSGDADSYREFMLEFADFQLAYEAGSPTVPDLTTEVPGLITGTGFADPARVINPPGKKEVGLPFLLAKPDECPSGGEPPCPEAVSADDVGTFTVNYRNEPVPLRVFDPATGRQAVGEVADTNGNFVLDTDPARGDLSFAYQTRTDRAIAQLNTILGDTPYPPLTKGLLPGDPFTPMMRAYENDKVQVRILVGATEEGHIMNIYGGKWYQEPSDRNSGYRNAQMIGISEHFEFVMPALWAVKGSLPFADYLYLPDASSDGQWNGLWGLMRAYNGGNGLLTGENDRLLPLPNNPTGKAPPNANPQDFAGVCPKEPKGKKGGSPDYLGDRKFSITAVLAKDVLPGGTLVYNSRNENGGPLHDPTAILYVRTEDLDRRTGKLKRGVPVEPLILRAAAGECVYITLYNRLPAGYPSGVYDPDDPSTWGFSTMPMIVDDFNANQVAPSSHVGLHPQMVTYDVSESDGANVGWNPVQTAPPGGSVTYKWYAGNVTACQGGKPASLCAGKADGTRVPTPVEFGAVNLIPSDLVKHSSKGAIGALIIEPKGSTWTEDVSSRASATVNPAYGDAFREFVLLFQDDVNLRFGSNADLPEDFDEHGIKVPGSEVAFASGEAVPNTADAEDPEDSGQKAFNYRTEPFWFRMGFAPDAPLEATRNIDFTDVLSNSKVGGDPETPVFTAAKGTPTRFRILEPGGHPRNHVFQLHGHIWQREPYEDGSAKIGYNPYSEWKGSQEGHGPSNHFDMVLMNGAGGKEKITGDFLYRDQASFQFDGGLWGIFRVTE